MKNKKQKKPQNQMRMCTTFLLIVKLLILVILPILINIVMLLTGISLIIQNTFCMTKPIIINLRSNE